MGGNGAEKEYILSGLLHEDERYMCQNLFDKRVKMDVQKMYSLRVLFIFVLSKYRKSWTNE